MTRALLVGARRTPVTPVHGELSGWHPVDLLAHTLESTMRSLGVDPAEVDAVFCGCAMPVGAQANSMARAAWLVLGWPSDTLVTMVEGGAASGHLALLQAQAAVDSGHSSCAVAAAVEVMSLVPDGATALARNYGRVWGDRTVAHFGDALVPPGLAAEQWLNGQDLELEELLRTVADRHRLRPVTALLDTDVLRRDGASILDERRTIHTDFHATLSTTDLQPLYAEDGIIDDRMIATMGDGAAAAVLSADPGRGRFQLVATHRAGGSAFSDPTLQRQAVDGLDRAADAPVILDESDIAVAVDADRHGFEPVVPGALASARPTSVHALRALADLEAIDAPTAVVASNLGLGAAIATRVDRV